MYDNEARNKLITYALAFALVGLFFWYRNTEQNEIQENWSKQAHKKITLRFSNNQKLRPHKDTLLPYVDEYHDEIFREHSFKSRRGKFKSEPAKFYYILYCKDMLQTIGREMNKEKNHEIADILFFYSENLRQFNGE